MRKTSRHLYVWLVVSQAALHSLQGVLHVPHAGLHGHDHHWPKKKRQYGHGAPLAVSEVLLVRQPTTCGYDGPKVCAPAGTRNHRIDEATTCLHGGNVPILSYSGWQCSTMLRGTCRHLPYNTIPVERHHSTIACGHPLCSSIWHALCVAKALC